MQTVERLDGRDSLRAWEGRKETKDIQKMLGGPKALIAVTVAEGVQEGQPGLLKRESEHELLRTNPQGPSS